MPTACIEMSPFERLTSPRPSHPPGVWRTESAPREEFAAVLNEHPDRIMLDNMSCVDMGICVHLLHSKGFTIETEASGNVSEATIRAIAETGVDYISVGSITHSVKAMDVHLVIV